MQRIVFVLGLCGSGKSERAKDLASQGFKNFDEKITGKSVNPYWQDDGYEQFVQAVVNGESCVVTDVAFYSEQLRQQVTNELKSKRRNVKIEWECYTSEGDGLEKANYNCSHDPERTPQVRDENLRQNKETVEYLKNGTYSQPTDCILRETVRCDEV